MIKKLYIYFFSLQIWDPYIHIYTYIFFCTDNLQFLEVYVGLQGKNLQGTQKIKIRELRHTTVENHQFIRNL